MKQNVTKLAGVGEAVTKKLKKLGIETVDNLINFYPRRYDDFSQITPISKLKPGQVTVQGKILRAVTRRTFRRGFAITEAIIDDGAGAVKAVWFNQPYLATSLVKNVPIFASGKLEFKSGSYALQHPVIEKVSDFPKDTARIVPVYPETAGLTSRQLRGLIKPILPAIKKIPDLLPGSLIKNEKLLTKAQALSQIHFPDSTKSLDQAKATLAFEELFTLILTSLIIKREIQTNQTIPIKFNEKLAKQFVNGLPFKLTDAQRKAAWQILQDIAQTTPMNRLLEGDVGSGKTVVAAMAIAMANVAGLQAALLAPTEILAHQHYKNLSKIFQKSTDRLILLSGGTKQAERTRVLDELASGQAGLVVGTHALLEPGVEFKALGLAIIDEQHRFGVNQRNHLKAKAKTLPHLLTMSATPIPRSLALTIYGDLDISVIDQMPPGRKPVKTKLIAEKDRHQLYQKIDLEIKAGRQVYVICPLISESDKQGAKSVEKEAERLKNDVLKHRQIGLLHGRMKAVEKAAVMQKFMAKKLDILVSTTVVEVGVDVPNASVMVVEGAERFGLATLHQLRGRVGRASHQSYCYLLTSMDSQAKQRLSLLEQHTDGFVLAQKDLELRGPGSIYGVRQHGLLDLRMANLADTKFIAHVREVAQAFLAKDNLAIYPNLLKKVNQLKAVTQLD